MYTCKILLDINIVINKDLSLLYCICFRCGKADQRHSKCQQAALTLKLIICHLILQSVLVFSKLPPGYESEGPKRKPKPENDDDEADEKKEGPHFISKPKNQTVVEGLHLLQYQ